MDLVNRFRGTKLELGYCLCGTKLQLGLVRSSLCLFHQ
jgi:hypothetical protein